MRIAVIGAGISGLGAAWALSRRHQVDMFEAASRIGGHANPVEVSLGGRKLTVDTGFIVYNERTYPNFVRLLDHLGVESAPSDMSFSFSVDDGLEYAGRLSGILVQPGRLLTRRYRRMVADIVRFRRVGELVERLSPEATVADLLRFGGFSDGFAEDYLLPMTAAIWSAPSEQIRSFPAATMFHFLSNHGLVRLNDRPQWLTIRGSSGSYLEKLVADTDARLNVSTPVRSVRRDPFGVDVTTEAGVIRYDQVILAVHSNQALELLGQDAAPTEREVLGGVGYQDNTAYLHTDSSLMPRSRRAWSSWNHLARPERDGSARVGVTYWMNRLQPLNTTQELFVSLNPPDEPSGVLGRFDSSHPQFDAASGRAQARLHSIQGVRRTWFAGAWCGYGFHEDGLQSGLAVASALGAPPPWAGSLEPSSPAPLSYRALQAVT